MVVSEGSSAQLYEVCQTIVAITDLLVRGILVKMHPDYLQSPGRRRHAVLQKQRSINIDRRILCLSLLYLLERRKIKEQQHIFWDAVITLKCLFQGRLRSNFQNLTRSKQEIRNAKSY